MTSQNIALEIWRGDDILDFLFAIQFLFQHTDNTGEQHFPYTHRR
jgi:hypothetical protein